LGLSHPDLTIILENLGDFYTEMRRYAAAESLFRRSLAILESIPAPPDVHVLHTLHGLSKTYLATGEKTQAERVLARAAEIARPRSTMNPEIPDVFETYAQLLKSLGRLKERNTSTLKPREPAQR